MLLKPTCTFFTLLTLCTLITTLSLTGQNIPRTISYQGVLAIGGAPIADGQHTLAVKVYRAGGVELFSQTLGIETTSGLFSTTLGPFPESLTFDGAYTLGIAVDGGAEFVPRTPLTSSPYALRAVSSESSELANRSLLADRASTAGRADIATEAEKLSPQATGVVKGVNGLEGAVEIIGGTGVVISEENGKISITLDGEGPGLQNIVSNDGTIEVSAGSGPTVYLDIAEASITGYYVAQGAINAFHVAGESLNGDQIEDGGIRRPELEDDIIATGKIEDGAVTTGKIADDAITSEKIGDDEVTLDKISHTGAEVNSTLKFDGTTPYWAEVPTASIGQIEQDKMRATLLKLEQVNATLLARIDLLEKRVEAMSADSDSKDRRAVD